MFYRGEKSETFCLAVAEAQALGLPVVATKIGALPERVIHQETGYIANSEQEFVQYALELLKNDELAEKLGKKAKQYASQYHWDISARKFISF
jgi:glycosyltransferase involved in cell wall biosynthesis